MERLDNKRAISIGGNKYMKIKNKRNDKLRFDCIKEGEVFSTSGEGFYMKIESTFDNDNGDYENAVNLKDGSLTYCRNELMVNLIECELVIS